MVGSFTYSFITSYNVFGLFAVTQDYIFVPYKDLTSPFTIVVTQLSSNTQPNTSNYTVFTADTP